MKKYLEDIFMIDLRYHIQPFIIILAIPAKKQLKDLERKALEKKVSPEEEKYLLEVIEIQETYKKKRASGYKKADIYEKYIAKQFNISQSKANYRLNIPAKKCLGLEDLDEKVNKSIQLDLFTLELPSLIAEVEAELSARFNNKTN